MKRLKQVLRGAVLLCILLLTPLFRSNAQAMSGSGVPEDPYIITTPADLSAMHNNLSAHYALGGDVNMANCSYAPVGNELDGPFTGSLDGKGFTISNLSIQQPETKFVGLFGYLEGTVSNVKLSNVLISGGRYVGGIAGNSGVGSSISDCHILSGTIKGVYSKIDLNAGGIVGLCEGELSNCSNAAEVCQNSNTLWDDIDISIGGIIGRCDYDNIKLTNCINYATIERGRNVGGIIGYASKSVIMENCENSGNNNAFDYAGGMIGKAGSAIQMTNCINSGSIGGEKIGGLIGLTYGTCILNGCENRGAISSGLSGSYYFAGGMLGQANDRASFIDCTNTGNISGYNAAGLCRCIWDYCTAISCTNSGHVEGKETSALGGTISDDCKSTVISFGYHGVSAPHYFLTVGETEQMRFTTIPALSSPNFSDILTWISSDESVASVSPDGVVTALGNGEATITCTTSTGLTDYHYVSVAPQMRLEPEGLTLEVGCNAQLTPIRTPECVDTYTWSSSSSNVVVSEDGIVTAVDYTGRDVTITVTSETSGRTATCHINVIRAEVPAQAIILDQTVLRPIPGELIQLTATVSPSNTTNKAVTWESSNPAVATVSTIGAVKAIAPGEAVITARTANGLYDTCHVKVVQLSSAAFVIPNSRGAQNDTFETTVQLVKNPGISAFTMELQYEDDALTPVSVSPGELLSDGTLTSNVDDTPNGSLRLTWYSAVDAVGDGAAFTIVWRADKVGSSPLSLNYAQEDICNAEKNEVRVSAESGVAYVLDRPIGDIYYDDLVNMKDIVYFARYFNNQETLDSSQRLAADLFYDDAIDVKDLTSLAQLLSENMPEMGRHKASRKAALRNNEGNPPFEVTVSSAVMTQNGSATLSVTGAECKGVAALRFQIMPPTGVEILSVQPSELLSSTGTFNYNHLTNIITWYSDTNQELNGKLFSITLHDSGGADLPGTMGLQYLPTDFFSAMDYSEVPVLVQEGTLDFPPYATIKDITLSDLELTARIETNMSNQTVLVVAFYQNGKMVHCITQNISTSGPYRLIVPSNLRNSRCIAFLVENDTFTPLEYRKELTIK